MAISYKRLIDLLNYDPETGIFTWVKHMRGGSNKNLVAGTVLPRGYVQICIDGKSYLAHRLAWMYTNGYWPEPQIDHINRNKSDNRICNLRMVSSQCNIRNIGNRKTNTSGVAGVYFDKRSTRWYSQVKVFGKIKSLGVYDDFADAVCARHIAEVCLNWNGCDSNSPAYVWIQKNIIGNRS